MQLPATAGQTATVLNTDGVPVVKEDMGDGTLRITGLVEKPRPADAPSEYAAIGGYVVTPGIIDELREQTRCWYAAGDPTVEVYLTTPSTPTQRPARPTARSSRAADGEPCRMSLGTSDMARPAEEWGADQRNTD